MNPVYEHNRRRFELLEPRPYIRLDGEPTLLRVWSYACEQCGRALEYLTPGGKYAAPHSAPGYLHRAPRFCPDCRRARHANAKHLSEARKKAAAMRKQRAAQRRQERAQTLATAQATLHRQAATAKERREAERRAKALQAQRDAQIRALNREMARIERGLAREHLQAKRNGALLSDADVIKLRADVIRFNWLLGTAETLKSLATEHGIKVSTVRRIVYNQDRRLDDGPQAQAQYAALKAAFADRQRDCPANLYFNLPPALFDPVVLYERRHKAERNQPKEK